MFCKIFGFYEYWTFYPMLGGISFYERTPGYIFEWIFFESIKDLLSLEKYLMGLFIAW